MVKNSKIIKYFFQKVSHTLLGAVNVLHRRRGAQFVPVVLSILRET